MKTIVCNTEFKHGDKSFAKGDLFDIDELNATHLDLCKMLKMGYVVWGECKTPVASKATVKEAPAVEDTEEATTKRGRPPVSKSRKADSD